MMTATKFVPSNEVTDSARGQRVRWAGVWPDAGRVLRVEHHEVPFPATDVFVQWDGTVGREQMFTLGAAGEPWNVYLELEVEA